MNETVKIATESLESLREHKKSIEEVFDEQLNRDIPGVDMPHAAKLYTAMYAAVEECIEKQLEVIDLLNIETLEGPTVGDVMDDIIEHNESMELSAIRFEKADKMIRDHLAEVTRLIEKGVV